MNYLKLIKKMTIILIVLVVIVVVGVNVVGNYNQNQNIKQLLDQNLDGRLIPHKVNYINKLQNVLNDNLRSFEFDTLFNSSSNIPYFEIGHDLTETKGVSFEKYLEIVANKKMKKIWMDLKNVQSGNIDLILDRLNYLDSKYKIKDILIVETNSTLEDVKKISQAGYHTSYYLPLTGLATDPNIAEKEASRIAKQIKLQKMKAISFSLDLYSFVKKYVEPKISSKIVYHTWRTYKFKRYKQLEKIQKQPFYHDNRVKTIIYSYFNNKPSLIVDKIKKLLSNN